MAVRRCTDSSEALSFQTKTTFFSGHGQVHHLLNSLYCDQTFINIWILSNINANQLNISNSSINHCLHDLLQ